MDREEWREIDRDSRRGGWRVAVWVIVIAVFIGALGAVGWAIGVAVSGPRGQGDAIAQRNSAENWVDAQRRFEENYQEYESTLVRIEQFFSVYQADVNDAVARTNWLGQISHCTDVIADYNADARNFLREDFRAADLPDQLNPDTCTTTSNGVPTP